MSGPSAPAEHAAPGVDTRTARAASLLLTFVVAGLSLPLLFGHGAAPPTGAPQRAAELVLPQVFAPLTGVSPDDAAAALAWLGESTGPWPRQARLHVGLTPLLLALLGLAGGLHLGTVLLALGVLALLLGGVAPAWVASQAAPTALVLGLSLLAGRGLTLGLTGRSAGRELLVAGAGVTLSGGLALWALRAGAAGEAAALAPLGLTDLPPALSRAAAAGLRAALDHAALAAFVAMSALLLLLRWRGRASAVLVIAVSAAELLVLLTDALPTP